MNSTKTGTAATHGQGRGEHARARERAHGATRNRNAKPAKRGGHETPTRGALGVATYSTGGPALMPVDKCRWPVQRRLFSSIVGSLPEVYQHCSGTTTVQRTADDDQLVKNEARATRSPTPTPSKGGRGALYMHVEQEAMKEQQETPNPPM